MILKIASAFLGLLAVAAIAIADVAIDVQYYCDLPCKGKSAGSHVMCSYPSTWGSACDPKVFYVNMTQARRDIFLKSTNTNRNIIAKGQLPGSFKDKTAEDMAEIIWDDELEMIAQKNLVPCSMGHDQSRCTSRHRFAGQNLAMACEQKPDGSFMTPEDAINKAQTGWWDEYKKINYVDARTTYSSIKSNFQYGHFTQMAQARAYAMGCATISTQGGFCYFTACNYAVTNMRTDPIYSVGSLRSKCVKNSTTYEGLCASNEDYFDFEQHDTGTVFVKDTSEVPTLKQWIDNGHTLITSIETPSRTPSNASKQKPFSAMGPTSSASSGTSSSASAAANTNDVNRRIFNPKYRKNSNSASTSASDSIEDVFNNLKLNDFDGFSSFPIPATKSQKIETKNPFNTNFMEWNTFDRMGNSKSDNFWGNDNPFPSLSSHTSTTKSQKTEANQPFVTKFREFNSIRDFGNSDLDNFWGNDNPFLSRLPQMPSANQMRRNSGNTKKRNVNID